MKTGDTLIDAAGATWTVESPLGRGVWGRTFGARGPSGALGVVKVPLRPSDFGERDDADALAEDAIRVAVALREQLAAREPTGSALARPLAVVPGAEALIFPRFGADLEARLQGGMALSEVLDLMVRLLHQLAHGAADAAVHGNLRPSNIFTDDDGRVVLADPVPAHAVDAWRRLAEVAAPSRVDYLPAEARHGAPVGGWDTWAVCQILHRACVASHTSDDPRRGTVVDHPRGGLTRVQVATIKDAASARFRTEDANKRFSARATEKLGAVLARGLSAELDPSPPFRFRTAAELLPRLIEVDDLVHPAVESVSKPLLATSGKEGVYEAGQPIELSITVGTTAGVTAQDDIACGVQLRDLDASDGRDGRVRVPNARFTVKRYPSGRWRFNFTLPDVAPGRYQLRVAFMIKGAEQDAQVSEGVFTVRPQPGYVPPPSHDHVPSALPMPDRLDRLDRLDRPDRYPDEGPSEGEVITFPGARGRGADEDAETSGPLGARRPVSTPAAGRPAMSRPPIEPGEPPIRGATASNADVRGQGPMPSPLSGLDRATLATSDAPTDAPRPAYHVPPTPIPPPEPWAPSRVEAATSHHRVGPAAPEAARSEPPRTEPARVPPGNDPFRVEPPRTEPGRAEAKRPESPAASWTGAPAAPAWGRPDPRPPEPLGADARDEWRPDPAPTRVSAPVPPATLPPPPLAEIPSRPFGEPPSRPSAASVANPVAPAPLPAPPLAPPPIDLGMPPVTNLDLLDGSGQGTDLPSYDDAGRGVRSPLEVWTEKLRELAGGGDLITTFMGVAASGFVLVVLLAAAFRSC